MLIALQGHLKNKFESLETPMRTGTVIVYCWSSNDHTRKFVRYQGKISSDSASGSRIAADRLFNSHFQSFVVP